jgi:hypothetical protein
VSTQHKIKFPQGKALLHLARTYPSLALCLLEMVQNAIDAEARKIHVHIDLGRHSAVIQDDGNGISVEKFDQALSSVMNSIKNPDKLGQFGIGLISPLDKVKSYTVTSKPREGAEIFQWTFDSEKIGAMVDTPHVPFRRVTALGAVPADWALATWRTVIRLNGIIRDKVTSIIDLEELHEQILGKYGTAMRNARTTCTIVLVDADGQQTSTYIQPREYTGQAIKPSTYKQTDAGDVTFRLYRANARLGKRTGKVTIHKVDDNFGVPWKDFVNQARATKWVAMFPAAFEALGSGFFEGVITAKNIQLHPERTKFVWDDALAGLYVAIAEWFEDVGKALLTDEKELAKADRFQQLGLTSLKRWDDLLDLPEYGYLRAALANTFVIGRMGGGHVDPENGKVKGEQEQTSLRTGQGGAGQKRTPTGEHAGKGNRANLPNEERDRDRPGDMPLSALGPNGNKRRLVRSDSIGLQLSYEPLDSVNLWELDHSLGILTFNTSNRLWARCEPRDAHILHLTEWVICNVLHLLILPQDQFVSSRMFVDQQAKTYVELFILSSPPKRR